MDKLHLDSEYRRRWQEYHMADGKVHDSRAINWRQIEWEKVIKIVTHMNGKTHMVDCIDKPDFKYFMCFRWGGSEAQYDKNGHYIGHTKINLWTQGYTDGETCFLEDIDFYTGNKVKEYSTPLQQFEAHIHPRCKGDI